MNKKQLSERDICTKFITPSLRQAGWDEMMQLREEVSFTKGQIIVRGKLVTRGKAKRADYILHYKPNIPLAVVEAKDNNCSVGDGMQQALEYAQTLQIPFVFSSNGDGFVFHDRTVTDGAIEKNLQLDEFPSPAALWARYREWKGLPLEAEAMILQDYFNDGSGKGPRYYQASAVNAAIEAIAKGQNRLLLVMATGTGKTYTAFQIIWRLWKAGRKKRILFLADRNVLVDQTMVNDFRPFGSAMAKLSTNTKVIEREGGARVELSTAIDKKRRIDTSYEIYLALYQAITGPEDRQKLFRELSPDFFDLIVVDECHRGSAAEDSAWREILEHFSTATQIGMTATPRETTYVSNMHYFGKPIYSYWLKQGIQDGFLAPYRVVKLHIDRDIEGYRPEPGKVDRDGQEIEDRIYNQKDFDRALVIDDRTKLVAKKVSAFLKESEDRFQKTIVFCVDTEHAARMRQALLNENSDLCAQYPRYVMRITGNDKEGVDQLDSFIDPEARFPVIVTTSRLLSTGVDAQTCRVIALDKNPHTVADDHGDPAELLDKRMMKSRSVDVNECPLAGDELPFEPPASWSWIRIGNAAHVEMGQSPSSDHYNQSREGMPFYQGKTDFGKRHPTPRYWCSQPTKIARKDDILISVRAPVGPTNVADEECCIGRGLVQALREAILNLAVRGRLVAQDDADEAASELVKRIEWTRARLYMEKRIPRPKDLPLLEDVEVPFEVCSGWQWTMLGELCYQVSDGSHHSPQYVSSDAGVPFLSTRNVRVDRFDLSNLKYVSKEDHEKFCERVRPERGDILYTKGGTTGIARVNDLDFGFSVWVHVAVLKVAKDFVDARCVAIALNSPLCYAQSQVYTQGISNDDLGLTRMIKILLPLPPIAEQHRIVAKVEELMTLCDGLEAQLTIAQTESRSLLDAVLQEALAHAS